MVKSSCKACCWSLGASRHILRIKTTTSRIQTHRTESSHSGYTYQAHHSGTLFRSNLKGSGCTDDLISRRDACLTSGTWKHYGHTTLRSRCSLTAHPARTKASCTYDGAWRTRYSGSGISSLMLELSSLSKWSHRTSNWLGFGSLTRSVSTALGRCRKSTSSFCRCLGSGSLVNHRLSLYYFIRQKLALLRSQV